MAVMTLKEEYIPAVLIKWSEEQAMSQIELKLANFLFVHREEGKEQCINASHQSFSLHCGHPSEQRWPNLYESAT